MSLKLIEIIFCLVILALPVAWAQAPADKPVDRGEIIVLEEVKIEVEPETPTVIVTIPRQKPNIQSVKLQSPIKQMIYTSTSKVKPRLADMKISKVDKPEKMLAKDRKD